MVGVGGRSKACDNCRRRRVKCDLALPECQRCMKARLQCGGPRDITIIPYKGQNSDNSAFKEPHSNAVPSTAEQCVAMTYRPGPNVHFRIPTLHDDLFIAYTHSYLLQGNEEIIVPSEADRKITGESFLALSTTFFGIEHREKVITLHGIRRYGNVLGILQKPLEDGNASQSFDVLEAVMIMALIEFLISDRKDGWINHSRGLEKLFDIRGPEGMTSLPCLMILERSRASIIFAAIVLRQRTILARREWKEQPWVLHPERIDSMKLLFDILADCPELFALRDQITSCPDESNNSAILQFLSAKSHCILQDLENWEKDWASSDSLQYTEIPSPPTSPKVESSDGLFVPAWPTILQYQSLYQANTMSVYNGAIILVIRFIQSLKLVLGDHNDSEALQERQHAARITICRSVDYHLDKLWGAQGSFALLFPLRMAYDAVGKTNPAIRIWLESVLDEIAAGSRGRWNTAKYLLGIGASNDTSAEK